jgi:hypothetical protein
VSNAVCGGCALAYLRKTTKTRDMQADAGHPPFLLWVPWPLLAEALRFPDLHWYYEVLRQMEMSGLCSRERRAIGCDRFHDGISFNDSPITTMSWARFYFRPRPRDCPRLPLQSQQPAAPLLSGRPRLQGSLPSSKQNRTAGSGLAGPSGCRPRLTQSVF